LKLYYLLYLLDNLLDNSVEIICRNTRESHKSSSTNGSRQ